MTPGQYRSAAAAARTRRGRPEVVHVGAACRDVVTDDPRGWRMGGGVTYAALTTARLGIRTAAVVGVDDEARTGSELDLLRAAGVDLLLVRLAAGPVFLNVEHPTGRVQTCVQPSEPLPVPPLPAPWRAAPAWSLAPVAGEVRDEWLPAIPARAYVAVAWQGFLRNLVAGRQVTRRPPGPSALLERADLVGVSHHDVDPSTPIEALASLLHPAALLLVTQGVEGGLLVGLGADRHPSSELRYRATRSDGEVDPTGAGDTFLAALLATAVRPAITRPAPGRAGTQLGRPFHGRLDLALADPSHASLDLPFAAAAGSLVVEAPGLTGVPDLAAVLARVAREHRERAVYPTEAPRVGSYDEE